MAGLGERASRSRAYRLGAAVALVASFLIVWTTVVRDDGNGTGFFMVILAAAVGAVSAWFQPAGLARTMVGMAIMQVWLGCLIATEPATSSIPGGSSKILLFSGFFMALWLLSAAFFHAAAKADSKAAATS